MAMNSYLGWLKYKGINHLDYSIPVTSTVKNPIFKALSVLAVDGVVESIAHTSIVPAFSAAITVDGRETMAAMRSIA